MKGFNKKIKYSSVLFLPDIHAPYHNMDAILWAASLVSKYDVELVVNLGDITDQRAWSRFQQDPDFDNPTVEFIKLQKAMHWLHGLFPNMVIKQGNHDNRILKKAFEVGLPVGIVNSLEALFPFDGWQWYMENDLIINCNILVIHGDECGGNVIQKAQRFGMSVIQGHTHQASLSYVSIFDKTIFGLEGGCLVDTKSSAFRYASKNPKGCWVGVTLLLDGVPVLLPYPGKGKWK